MSSSPQLQTAPGSGPDPDTVRRLSAGLDELRRQIGRLVIGQEGVVEEVLLCLLTGGHGLLEGVPGLAKTLLVRTLARGLKLDFRRIQFTPDLMPGDVTGTEIIEDDRTTGGRALRFLPGPVFTHVLLADEINRAPPKTQAALLEAMQEGRVTAAGETRPIPSPFLVLATQNPLEQEGTYPLPEAQLDRFLLKIRVPYPSADEERRILAATTGRLHDEVDAVLGAEEVLLLRRATRQIPVNDALLDYAVRLVRATRPGESDGIEPVTEWLRWGAGPRAGQALILAGKARALLRGRLHLAVEDVRAVAPGVFRHRILPTFRAEAEGLDPDTLVTRLLDRVPAPASGVS
ncbi:MAG: MoxR family ATPase [Gemmatimonadales bacterium]|nr:MAG: MoxR family ATPase [Gemmatimonadales bacterium]